MNDNTTNGNRESTQAMYEEDIERYGDAEETEDIRRAEKLVAMMAEPDE